MNLKLRTWEQLAHHHWKQLWSKPPQTATERITYKRQARTLELGAYGVVLLSEPFRKESTFSLLAKIVLALHFHARVVDDALDEGMPIHLRQNCLAQPQIITICQQFQTGFPQHVLAFEQLMNSWFSSIAQGDDDPIADLGQRSMHFLLFDLCYADTKMQHELLQALWWMQITEELHSELPPLRREAILQNLSLWTSNKRKNLLDHLHDHGYHSFVKQLQINMEGV